MKAASTDRCPVDMALDLVGGKWKSLVLYRLSAGTLRFGQLQRSIPEVTQRMLTLQLRELERDGLVRRVVYAEVPPKVEYSLTPPAQSLTPVLEQLGGWFHQNVSALQEYAQAESSASDEDLKSPLVRGG